MTAMEGLEKQVTGIDTKVTSILILLRGHDMDKDDKGMIGVQNEHEDRIIKLEKLKDRLVYFLFGLSIPAGWGIMDIIKRFAFND
jgi:hypothetical protein